MNDSAVLPAPQGAASLQSLPKEGPEVWGVLRGTSGKGGVGKNPGDWITPGLALWFGLSHHVFHEILELCKLLLCVEDWLWTWEKRVPLLLFHPQL